MDTHLLDTTLGYTVTVLEGLAALFAFIFYKKYSHTYLRFFPWLLLYVFLNEIFAGYFYEVVGNNARFYNVYNIIFFLYFYFVFYTNEHRKAYKRLILLAASCFVIVCIINSFTQSFVSEPQLIAYLFGACVLLFCIILYFIEILYTPQILHIRKDLLFWVSIGLLLFYVGYIPIKVAREFFEHKGKDYITLGIVHRILVMIMNTCFIIGFLWTRKK